MPETRQAKRARQDLENVEPVPVKKSPFFSTDYDQDGRLTVSPFHLSQAALDATPNRQLRILAVPVEIFDEIIHHLPLHALVCFTLTCKAVLHLVGTAPWDEFKHKSRDDPERMSFMKLLCLDVPSAYFCCHCVAFHPSARLRPPNAYRSADLENNCLAKKRILSYWQVESKGYILSLPHIHAAFKTRPEYSGFGRKISPPILEFSGDHTIQVDFGSYRLLSSARWIDRNLIVSHEHHLQPSDDSPHLRAEYVNALPLRLCPHFVTITPRPRGLGWNHAEEQWLLSRAVSTALPENLRAQSMNAVGWISHDLGAQIKAAERKNGSDSVWRCSQCATKFWVRYEASKPGGKLVVTSWHCFGKEWYQAEGFWRDIVGRSREYIGGIWHIRTSPSRIIRDFAID